MEYFTKLYLATISKIVISLILKNFSELLHTPASLKIIPQMVQSIYKTKHGAGGAVGNKLFT